MNLILAKMKLQNITYSELARRLDINEKTLRYSILQLSKERIKFIQVETLSKVCKELKIDLLRVLKNAGIK